ncbi:MAG TPA: SCO family protein [Usitatibacter sp.]|nr:SCO family protein [Usitatibacter sp.]
MRRLAALLAALLALAACDRLVGNDGPVRNVAGLVHDLRFTMTDPAGRTVRAADFRGGPVLVYFGYIHCPDVCPTTLARLAHAAETAGPRDLRIVFVTVDPGRDTLAQLAAYAQAFGPRVTGLRPSEDELAELAKRYRVSYSRAKPDARGEYEVMHSSGVFAFDAEGRARLMILPGASERDIESALRRLSGPSRGKA